MMTRKLLCELCYECCHSRSGIISSVALCFTSLTSASHLVVHWHYAYAFAVVIIAISVLVDDIVAHHII